MKKARHNVKLMIMTEKPRKLFAVTTGLLLAAITSLPLWNPAADITNDLIPVWAVVIIVGMALGILNRKDAALKSFAGAVTAVSMLAYIGLIFLSFAIVDSEYSQWNIFNFFLMPFLTPFYYTGGIIAKMLQKAFFKGNRPKYP